MKTKRSAVEWVTNYPDFKVKTDSDGNKIDALWKFGNFSVHLD